MRATKLTNYENNCTCLSQYNHTIISQKSRESTAQIQQNRKKQQPGIYEIHLAAI